MLNQERLPPLQFAQLVDKPLIPLDQEPLPLEQFAYLMEESPALLDQESLLQLFLG